MGGKKPPKRKLSVPSDCDGGSEVSNIGQNAPLLRDYDVKCKIGSDSDGAVHACQLKAECWSKHSYSTHPKTLAVKVISKGSKNGAREVENMLKLSHPNVIKLYGTEEIELLTCLKMELANCDLKQLVPKLTTSKLYMYEFTHIADQILKGLSYLHNENIAHRDLKPTNILAKWDHVHYRSPKLYNIVIMLCDFGLSKVVSDESESGSAVGTRKYMAPEVLKAFVDGVKFVGDYRKADVFSAGVVLYELWFGQKPFSESELRKVHGRPLDVSEHLHIFKDMLKWSRNERCSAEVAECYLKSLLKPKATVNVINEDCGHGKTTIHFALSSGNLDTAKWLIDSGGDVNKADEKGWTPLTYALMNDQLPVAKLLIEKGADLNMSDNDGYTALHYCCQNDQFVLVQYLLKNGAVINISAHSGRTPLLVAFEECNLIIAQFLIEKGADLNKADNNNSTVLHYACRRKNFSFTQFLTEKGANLNKVDNDGYTPLHVSCQNAQLSIVQYLLERGADTNATASCSKTPLHTACEMGHLTMAIMLIDKGASVNKADETGWTPLHYIFRSCFSYMETSLKSRALQENHSLDFGDLPCSNESFLLLTKLLISKGAEVNRLTDGEYSPLHFSCMIGHLPITRLLLENEADIKGTLAPGLVPLIYLLITASSTTSQFEPCFPIHDDGFESLTKTAVDDDYYSLLHIRIACARLPIKELMEDICELKVRSQDALTREMLYMRGSRFTPLHVAIICSHHSIAELLIGRGADVNKQSVPTGITPLYLASSMGHWEIAKLLVEKGAVVNAARRNGLTPLHAACHSGKRSIISLLLNCGADINRADDFGLTPLHLVCQVVGKFSAACLSFVESLHPDRFRRYGWTPIEVACRARGSFNSTYQTVDDYFETSYAVWSEHHASDSSVFRLGLRRTCSILKADHYAEMDDIGDLSIVSLLVQKGALVNKGNKNGWTPLHLASQGGACSIVRLLIGYGANINEAAIDHQTQFQRDKETKGNLFRRIDASFAKLFSKKGWTPLHEACRRGHLEVAKVLLRSGADKNATTASDEKPLDQVVDSKKPAFSELFSM